MLGKLGDVFAEQPDGTRSGLMGTTNAVKQRGLSGAIGPNHDPSLTLRDLQRNGIDSANAAKHFTYLLNRKGQISHDLRPPFGDR
jgi:hypothetical protein